MGILTTRAEGHEAPTSRANLSLRSGGDTASDLVSVTPHTLIQGLAWGKRETGFDSGRKNARLGLEETEAKGGRCLLRFSVLEPDLSCLTP